MRLEFINRVRPGEILAKSILTSDGKVLLNNGVKLTEVYISKLKELNIYYLYIEDDRLDDIEGEDSILNELKIEAVKNISNIYKRLSLHGPVDIKETYKSMENLIDYIMSIDSISTNLMAIKTHDNYTYLHSVDTGILSGFLGKNLGMSKEDLVKLGMAAVLHDVGKIKIKSSILNKRTPLTSSEAGELKKHPEYGEEVLRSYSTIPSEVITGIKQHHERVDGNGYPRGLKKNAISKIAKIISICDVYDAVSRDRSYRKKFNPSDAYELILAGSGSIFDEKIVSAFKRTFSVYPLGTCLRLSNEVEGYVVRQNKNFPDRPVVRVLYNSKTKEPISFYEIDLLEHTDLVVMDIV
ncbi:HD-GYP domain-containing protein [Clostridium polynesiense]|uniref:HD-GYP domain-containing protein n=1 Tax=Clostridium polynesiense TaxID=1325933 RepID=UPI00058FC1AD|nr:HD-GYP domain-containing protein [Clostridium polynesiense]